MDKKFAIGIGVLALLVVVALAGSSESGSTPATATPTATTPAQVTATVSAPSAPRTAPPVTAPPSADRAAVTIKGSGTSKSKPFALAGTYAVEWTATPDGTCYHGAFLERADGERVSETLVNEILKGAKAKTGSTHLYNLDPADYYIDATSGCAWSFTITPS